MKRTSLLVAVCLLASLIPSFDVSAKNSASLTIAQIAPQGRSNGEWVLIKPDNTTFDGTTDRYEMFNLASGTYTLKGLPPEGATTRIELFRSGRSEQVFDRPQINFQIRDGDKLSAKITYTYTRVGKVSVNSSPKGLKFRLAGPNNISIRGKTPESYDEMPEGQWAAYFDDIEGCPAIPPQSQRLEKDSRVQLSVSLDCEGLASMEEEEVEGIGDYVTISIDAEKITLHDVRRDAWFGTYAAKVARANIMTGTKDRRGRLTGEFNPSGNVTVAALAKIAHRIAGMSVDENATARNTRVRGTWAEPFVASAEKKDWLVFADRTLDPNRPATRSEVVATLLQALDVPRLWAKGQTFRDVKRTTPYASSIETASVAGIIDGYTNADGSPSGRFGPNDSITRAAMAKVLSNAIDLYLDGGN